MLQWGNQEVWQLPCFTTSWNDQIKNSDHYNHLSKLPNSEKLIKLTLIHTISLSWLYSFFISWSLCVFVSDCVRRAKSHWLIPTRCLIIVKENAHWAAGGPVFNYQPCNSEWLVYMSSAALEEERVTMIWTSSLREAWFICSFAWKTLYWSLWANWVTVVATVIQQGSNEVEVKHRTG